MIYRYFTKARSYRYIDHLQDFVRTYNATPHASLDSMSPAQVNLKNQSQLWSFLYLKKSRRSKQYRFRIGDYVRISHARKPFTRGYEEQFTPEIFKVHYRYRLQGIPLYKLKDFLNQSMQGSFYQYELLPVFKDENSLWLIEKIIRRRKIEVLVKFVGWNKRFNTWLPQAEIQHLNRDRY